MYPTLGVPPQRIINAFHLNKSRYIVYSKSDKFKLESRRKQGEAIRFKIHLFTYFKELLINHKRNTNFGLKRLVEKLYYTSQERIDSES